MLLIISCFYSFTLISSVHIFPTTSTTNIQILELLSFQDKKICEFVYICQEWCPLAWLVGGSAASLFFVLQHLVLCTRLLVGVSFDVPTTVSLECGALIILVVVVLFWQRFQGWSSSTGFGFLWPSLISEVVYVLGLIRHSNATGAVCGMCCLDTTLAEDVFCFYGFDMWIVVYAVHSLLHTRVTL